MNWALGEIATLCGAIGALLGVILNNRATRKKDREAPAIALEQVRPKDEEARARLAVEQATQRALERAEDQKAAAEVRREMEADRAEQLRLLRADVARYAERTVNQETTIAQLRAQNESLLATVSQVREEAAQSVAVALEHIYRLEEHIYAKKGPPPPARVDLVARGRRKPKEVTNDETTN